MSPTDAHSTGAQAAAPAEQAAAPGLGCLWCLFPEPRRQKAAVVAVAPHLCAAGGGTDTRGLKGTQRLEVLGSTGAF